MTIDFDLHQHGSIAVLTARSDAARGWQEEHLPADALRWAGGTVIEPRCLGDILAGLSANGLIAEVM